MQNLTTPNPTSQSLKWNQRVKSYSAHAIFPTFTNNASTTCRTKFLMLASEVARLIASAANVLNIFQMTNRIATRQNSSSTLACHPLWSTTNQGQLRTLPTLPPKMMPKVKEEEKSNQNVRIRLKKKRRWCVTQQKKKRKENKSMQTSWEEEEDNASGYSSLALKP